MKFSFNISAQAAFSPYHHSAADWQNWAKNPEQFLAGKSAGSLSLDFIPAMQRRRLSLPAKLMFASLEALNAPAQTPLIYASNDGETARSFELWLELLGEGTMSPMSFGLAVHNALAGSWSLFKGTEAEMNAVAVHDAVLETALLEAYLLLTDGAPAVNVGIAELPLPKQYDVNPVVRAPFAHALAFTITQGDDYQLTFAGETCSRPSDFYWGGLEFLRWHYAGGQTLTQCYAGGTWTWQKR